MKSVLFLLIRGIEVDVGGVDLLRSKSNIKNVINMFIFKKKFIDGNLEIKYWFIWKVRKVID